MKVNENKTLTLVNLGGPRNASEIEVFLRDLFLDPFVFDLPLPEFLRKKLGRFIAKKRAPKVAKNYESMGFGGGSPLVSETQKQAKALENELNQISTDSWNIKVAMTCGYPNIRDVEFSVPNSENIYLPLYPHFSRSTVLSTYNILKEKFGFCPVGSGGIIPSFGWDPEYWELSAKFILNFFTQSLNEKDYLGYKEFPKDLDWRHVDIIFSAHGIPMRLVNKGDQYIQEIKANVDGICSLLKKEGFLGNYHISYQSKVGPAKWTEPNTIPVVTNLSKLKKDIVIVPISFVSDHLETLEEIGEEFKELAHYFGAKSFSRVPAFGTYRPFIQYLAKLVLKSDSEIKSCVCELLGGEFLGNCRFKN